MQRNINLLQVIPIPQDGTSYYRGAGVFGDLIKRMPELQLINVPFVNGQQMIDWHILERTDIVFMQRPCHPSHLQIAQLCKEGHKKIKIWCDWDDNLFEVPKENPQEAVYSDPNMKNSYIELMKIADVVTTTTPALHKFISQFNKNVVIIPNAFNDNRFNRKDPHKLRDRKTKDKNRILWRGGDNHMKNLSIFADQLTHLNRENLDWFWMFFGMKAYFIEDAFRQGSYNFIRGLPVIKFMEKIEEIFPKVSLVCHYNSLFNQSRSNIAWLETAYLGESVTVAPNWEQWRVPGCFTYGKNDDFVPVVEKLMHRDYDPRPDVRLAIEYINDNLLLSKVNEKRMEIIRSAVS